LRVARAFRQRILRAGPAAQRASPVRFAGSMMFLIEKADGINPEDAGFRPRIAAQGLSRKQLNAYFHLFFIIRVSIANNICFFGVNNCTFRP